jgi:hypothetical protein
MTMLGGRENFFGVGSSGKGWVMIGGYQNNLGGTYGSSQAEDGPVLIGGRNNTLGASTGGGMFAGYENTQQGNTDASVIIGGRNNTLWADAQFAAIVGASACNQKSGYGGIIGGYINTNQGDYNAYIYGGQENEIKVGSYNNNTILGGCNNTIYAIPLGGPSQFEPGTTIIGGRYNSISGSTHFSTIVGGYQNLMLHSGSVILGGRAITSSAHNTTFVPNLNVSGSAIFSGSALSEVSALSISSQTASLDCSTGNSFTLTLVSGSTTFLNPTNIQPGQTINVRITQPATAFGSMSFPSSIKQPSANVYTPTLSSDAVDIITLVSFDSSSLYLSSVKNLA